MESFSRNMLIRLKCEEKEGASWSEGMSKVEERTSKFCQNITELRTNWGWGVEIQQFDRGKLSKSESVSCSVVSSCSQHHGL